MTIKAHVNTQTEVKEVKPSKKIEFDLLKHDKYIWAVTILLFILLNLLCYFHII